MSRPNPTYQDIANYTGFSKTTISRYFNRPDTVTPKNRAKIRHALEVLDYKSNKVARILAKGQTEFIGLVVPNLYLSFYGEILDQFLKSFEKYGYKFIVFSGTGSEETERRYLDELQAYHVEGLIVLSHTLPSIQLASLGLPVVAIEREDLYISSVNTDNYAGGVAAARHLLQIGCDMLIHINKDEIDSRIPAYGRREGFLDVCRRENAEHAVFNYVQEADYADLAQQTAGILQEIIDTYPARRKGLFCSNDTIAEMVLNDLFRRYGKLPEDFSIIGFDGTPSSEHAILPLSTVQQQIGLLVDHAMELLIDQIRHKKETGFAPLSEPVHRMIPPVLKLRSTT